MRGYIEIQPTPRPTYCPNTVTNGSTGMILAGVGITLLPTLALVSVVVCWQCRKVSRNQQVQKLEKLWQLS